MWHFECECSAPPAHDPPCAGINHHKLISFVGTLQSGQCDVFTHSVETQQWSLINRIWAHIWTSGRSYLNTKKPQDGAVPQAADVICGLVVHWPISTTPMAFCSKLTNRHWGLPLVLMSQCSRTTQSSAYKHALHFPLHFFCRGQWTCTGESKKTCLQLLYCFFLLLFFIFPSLTTTVRLVLVSFGC